MSRKVKAAKATPSPGWRKPVFGILLGGVALVALLGLSSYRPRAAAENLAGPVGHSIAGLLLEAAGVGGYAAALFILALACALVAGRPRLSFGRATSWLLFSAATMALVDLLVHGRLQGHAAGGALGAILAGAARGALSTTGASVVLSAVALAALAVATDLWALRAAAAAGRLSVAGGALALRGAMAAVERARLAGPDSPDFDHELDDDDEGQDAGDEGRIGISEPPPLKKLSKKAQALALAAAVEPLEDPRLAAPLSTPPTDRAAAGRKDAAREPALTPAIVLPLPEQKPSARASKLASAAGADVANAEVGASSSAASAADARRPADAAIDAQLKPSAKDAALVAGKPVPAAETKGAAPTIVEPKAPPRPNAQVEAPRPAEPAGHGFIMNAGHKAFVPPPISILTGEATVAAPLDREALTQTAEKLRLKLASFGIEGQVTQIRPGPVVTMFEFLPAAGVKVSRIASLSDDLAMAMEAMRVRIVAPIPGKGVVGIEVPNRQRQSVVLRELVEQDAFQKSQSKLAMCLGKDIEGMPYVADLAKMPHLLIAGTTGSGKSVAVNSMIVSMLLRASPDDVRFLMVDPKMLELSVYEGIPHLLLPVVTDSKKAAMALRWGVEEMERRYQLLSECGVRNIAQYNKKVEKEGEGARKPVKEVTKPRRIVDLTDTSLDAHALQMAAASGQVERLESDNPAVQLLRANERKIAAQETGAEWLQKEMQAQGQPIDIPGKQEALTLEPLRKLPYIVIIIDELADLMMVASSEVETYIARLAGMARAAGIHLMVATQRPSTDVVTGVIKANFPARISFQVASRHDSATIINTQGAENLLGMGDMLILPPGTSTLTRVHGPYVDEKEIHAVVEHWKAQGSPVYDTNILKPRAEDGEGVPADDEVPDDLYDQAIASLADMRFISISLLQRKLRVGYNRSARMIERMERDGIVGPADGAKPREVLVRALGQMPGAGA